MPVSAQEWRELTAAMSGLGPVLRNHTEAMLANLPQIWGTKELSKRWDLCPSGVSAVLRRYTDYVPQTGVPIRVPLEIVLMLDRILKKSTRVQINREIYHQELRELGRRAGRSNAGDPIGIPSARDERETPRSLTRMVGDSARRPG